MRVSIEIPAFKGQWLVPCIESVFDQTSSDWELSIIWDGGDSRARAIVERLDEINDPRCRMYIGDRRGIATARRFLTERSTAEWILPLDDDDVLARDAVETFLAAAQDRPWAGIIRARRGYINEAGSPMRMAEWFPFEPRHFQFGMVKDLHNHCQPYLIRRSAYERTAGWSGFPDYFNAGEDCDIFAQIEEVAPIELYDRVLYYYRINSRRASYDLTPAGARELWRRIADRSIGRLGLFVKRTTEEVPFEYQRVDAVSAARSAIDFVIRRAPGAMETRKSLLRDGVSDYAVRTVAGSPAVARNQGFRHSTQPFVCFLQGGVSLGQGAVDELIARMNEPCADVVAVANPSAQPSLVMMARREVCKAVGGFEDYFAADELVASDFVLKALQRGFVCATAATSILAGANLTPPSADELSLFSRKWPAQALPESWRPSAIPAHGTSG
jgi:glycosyltransferase involved in cell wall biosynthesis